MVRVLLILFLCSSAFGQAFTLRDPAFVGNAVPRGSGYSPTPDILWWKGQTGSGTTDTATVGPNATLQNADMWATTFTPGGSTSDILFAAFRYINSASTVAFSTNKITVEFRTYSDSWSNGVAPRAFGVANLGTSKNAWGIVNQTEAGGGKFEVRYYDNSFNFAQYTFTRPSASAWHHIAIVCDDSAAIGPTVYVDGSTVSVTQLSETRSSFAAYGTSSVFVGSTASEGGNDFGFTMYMKDIRIFSGARSAANIAIDATNYP